MRRGREVKERKQKEAAERDAYCVTLSLEDRFLLCEQRQGESKRERERILRQIAERDAPKAEKKKQPSAKQDKKAQKAKQKLEAKDS